MAKALTAHLAYLRACGRPIRGPRTDAGRIAV
jgi:hypothetical protein